MKTLTLPIPRFSAAVALMLVTATACGRQPPYTMTAVELTNRAKADAFHERGNAISRLNGGFVVRIHSELAGKDFDSLDGDLGKLDAAFQRDATYEILYEDVIFSFEVCDAPVAPTTGDDLNSWVQARPSDPWAHVVRAIYYFGLGCRARGSKYADGVTQAQWAEMERYHKLSLSDLDLALQQNSKLMPAYVVLLDIYRLEGRSDDEAKTYRVAHSMVPQSYLIVAGYMDALEPRWSGSYQAMEEFGRQLSKEATVNPRFWSIQGSAEADRGDIAYSNGDYREAFKHYDAALKFGDNTVWLDWGYNAARGMNDFRAAIDYGRRRQRYEPGEDKLLTQLQKYCQFNTTKCRPSTAAAYPWRGEPEEAAASTAGDLL